MGAELSPATPVESPFVYFHASGTLYCISSVPVYQTAECMRFLSVQTNKLVHSVALLSRDFL